MNFVLDNWSLILLALVSGGMLLWPVLAGGMAKGTSAQDVVQLMNREKAAVVDVREPDEFASGHIVGARNIPLGQLEAQLAGAVKNKQAPLVLVCLSGARSGRALSIAKRLGYEQASSLSGGMKAWTAANLPVVAKP